MDKKTVSKVWNAIALSLLYITLNAWTLTQKTDFGLPLNLFKGFEKQPYATAIFAIFICAPMFWCLLFLQTIFLERYKGNSFWERFPIAFDLEFDFSFKESIYYQRFFFFCFQIIPIGGQIHFIDKFFANNTLLDKYKNPIGLWDISKIASGCKYDGVDFFPFIEPMLLTIFVLISIFYWIYYLYRVYKNPWTNSVPTTYNFKCQ